MKVVLRFFKNLLTGLGLIAISPLIGFAFILAWIANLGMEFWDACS